MPISINNFIENVLVPRTSAKSFKENWQKATVSSIRHLDRSLEAYNYTKITITHPTNGEKYPYGK